MIGRKVRQRRGGTDPRQELAAPAQAPHMPGRGGSVRLMAALGVATLPCGPARADEPASVTPAEPVATDAQVPAPPAAAPSGRAVPIVLVMAGSVLTAAAAAGASFTMLLEMGRCFDGCVPRRLSDAMALEAGSFAAWGLGGFALGYGAASLLIAVPAIDGAGLAMLPERYSERHYSRAATSSTTPRSRRSGCRSCRTGWRSPAPCFWARLPRAPGRALRQPVVSSGTVGVTAAGLF